MRLTLRFWLLLVLLVSGYIDFLNGRSGWRRLIWFGNPWHAWDLDSIRASAVCLLMLSLGMLTARSLASVPPSSNTAFDSRRVDYALRTLLVLAVAWAGYSLWACWRWLPVAWDVLPVQPLPYPDRLLIGLHDYWDRTHPAGPTQIKLHGEIPFVTFAVQNLVMLSMFIVGLLLGLVTPRCRRGSAEQPSARRSWPTLMLLLSIFCLLAARPERFWEVSEYRSDPGRLGSGLLFASLQYSVFAGLMIGMGQLAARALGVPAASSRSVQVLAKWLLLTSLIMAAYVGWAGTRWEDLAWQREEARSLPYPDGLLLPLYDVFSREAPRGDLWVRNRNCDAVSRVVQSLEMSSLVIVGMCLGYSTRRGSPRQVAESTPGELSPSENADAYFVS